MKRPSSYTLNLLVTLCLFFLMGEAGAGVVVEQQMRERDGKGTQVVIYFSENRMRTDHPERGLSTVMDFKEDRMIMIDHASKNFVQVKFTDWEREMSAQLKKEAPPASWKKKIVAKKTGKIAVVNGFKTEKIEILVDGELIEENWVTKDVDLREMEKVMDRVAKGFTKDLSEETRMEKEIYEKLKPHGFPILIKDYTLTHGMKAIDRLEVKKVEKKELKDEVFLPPAGYQQIIPESGKK